MRATLLIDELRLQAGEAGTAVIEVTNTLSVIDGVSASARTPEGLSGTASPSLLPLFPGSSGELTLSITAGRHFPAGTHAVTIVLTSSVVRDEVTELVLPLHVEPSPDLAVSVNPLARRGHSRARYEVKCSNDGNTTLHVELAAADAERVLQARVVPPILTVPPGEAASADLRVRGRRHLLGSEQRHRVSILARDGELQADTSASFRQRPIIPAGTRTAAVLAVIVALWAAVFVVALTRMNSLDPLTKEVPPSFYTSTSSSRAVNASAFRAFGQLGELASATSGGAPSGAVPKTGIDIGVGGTVNGTVRAASTASGIGRITVQAVRNSPKGPVLVSSAATGADGSYSLVGLLPGNYKLKFSAVGFQTMWYPRASSEAQAADVTVDAQAQTNGIDVTISGLDGSISGTVETGQTPSPPVTVTVVPEQGAGKTIATVTTDSSGHYTIPSLPAPGAYDLSFTASGYQVASDTEQVAGGEAHIANTVTLSAGPGTLGGTVTDGKNPLGGVTITANANGQTVKSATPTTGAVGHFSIPNLATPATYLLTFSDPGYGTDTIAEHLGPGQSLTNLVITLSGGAGQISGDVTSTTGGPLGGVTVTVDNLATPVTTETLTAGSIGSYLLSGLATPGDYTLTFSLSGYQSQTIAVKLSSAGSATGADVKLAPRTGTITGTVDSSGGAALTGVTVTITNGTTVKTVTTTSSPAGGYSLSGLAADSYSVSFSLAGYQTTTVLVHLGPGQTANASVSMTPSASP